MTTETRHSGRVLFYRKSRSHGFIRNETGGNIYFGRPEMLRSGFVLDRGDRIEFAIGHGKGGRPRAVDILLLSRAPESITADEIEAREYAAWCQSRGALFNNGVKRK